MSQLKLVFLDRDGVINQDSLDYIKHPDEWQPIRGSLEAIENFNKAGWKVAVVTNQSVITRKYCDVATLSGIHTKLSKMLTLRDAYIDWISYSPYQDEHQSSCRKPEAGLLKIVARKFNISPDGCPMIGDTWKDIEAALKVNAKPILVKTGKGKKTIEDNKNKISELKIPTADNLLHACNLILDNKINCHATA